MSGNLAITPFQTRPSLKVLHFGSKETESGQITRALNKELDAAEKKMGIKPDIKEEPDYVAMKPDVAISFLSQRLANFADKSYELAYKDALTGLHNRAAYNKDRSKLFISACKEQKPLSFLYLDLDKFKSYNDEFGHPEGDVALKEYGRILEHSLGEEGEAYRVGGEELTAVVPDADYKKANQIAEKIRKNLEAQTKELHKDGILKRPLTVSIGYSTLEPKPEMQEIEETLKKNNGNKSQNRDLFKSLGTIEKMADAALYLAKNDGRNCVRGANEFSR